MRNKVVLKILRYRRSLREHLATLCAIEENRLRPEHFGNFRKHRRSSKSHHHIAKSPYNGIGGDAGKPVRASALHPHHKLGEWKLRALVTRHRICNLGKEAASFSNFVLHILADEELDAA